MKIVILGLPSDVDQGRVETCATDLARCVQSTRDLFAVHARGGLNVRADVQFGDELPGRACQVRVVIPHELGGGLCRGFGVWLMLQLRWLAEFLPVRTDVIVVIQSGSPSSESRCRGVIEDGMVRIGSGSVPIILAG